MEMGYGTGESIGFWNKLYPDASLIVLDKDTALSGEGFEVLKCEQSCADQLLEIVNDIDNSDIGLIVDDGFHAQNIRLYLSIFFSNILGLEVYIL